MARELRTARGGVSSYCSSALEVIVARGYADTRIADVAEHAGTSPALVIYYFKTRDQLLTEAIRYSEDALVRGGTKRLESITTAAGQLTEMIAMTCLPDTDPAPRSEWLLWLDLWALSPRNTGVAAVRRKFDERWRQTIKAIVLCRPGGRRVLPRSTPTTSRSRCPRCSTAWPCRSRWKIPMSRPRVRMISPCATRPASWVSR